MSYSIRG